MENHSLHLLQMKDLAGILIVMSSGWSLFVRLCGTIKPSQKCFWHRSGITSLSCLLSVSMIIKGICPFRYVRLAFTCCKYGKLFWIPQLIFLYSANGKTIKSSESINPYACTIEIKHQFFDTWLAVEHIPREISHHLLFLYGRRW